MEKINLNNYEAFLLDYMEGNLSESALAALRAFSLLHPELNIDLDNNDLPYLNDKPEISSDFKKDLLKTEEDLPAYHIINYLEGNLNPAEKIEFEKKLTDDRNLAEELNAYKKVFLNEDEKEIFDRKEELLKTEEEFSFNHLPFLYVEGLLSEKERAGFESDLEKDAALKTEVRMYKNTRLHADVSVIYPDKNSLKKETKVFALFSVRNLAAAAVLLFIGLTAVFIKFNTVTPVSEEIVKAEKNPLNKQPEKITVPSEIKINETLNQKNNLVAHKKTVKKKMKQAHNLAESKDSVITEAGNNFIAKENNESGEPQNNPTEIKTTGDSALAATGHENLLKDTASIEMKKQAVLLAYEEEDEEENEEENPSKTSFWKRAVRIARQANSLGVKAVNGDEKVNGNYVLSFNSFSIEKK